MENKIVKAVDVFRIIDDKANYIFKKSNGDIYWTSIKPNMLLSNDDWTFTLNGVGGNLGKIEIEEFSDKDWKDCLYFRGGCLIERDLKTEIEILRQNIKELENEIKQLKDKNADLKMKVDYYERFKEPWSHIQKFPNITLCNNEEK